MQNCNLKWNNWQPFTFTQRVIITVPTPRLPLSQLSDDNFSPFWQNIQELFITNPMPIKDARWLFHFQCNQHKRVCRGGKKSVLLFMALSLPSSLWFSRTKFPFPIEIWLEGSNSSWISLGWIEREVGGGGWLLVPFQFVFWYYISSPDTHNAGETHLTSIKETTQTASCALSPTRGQGGCI